MASPCPLQILAGSLLGTSMMIACMSVIIAHCCRCLSAAAVRDQWPPGAQTRRALDCHARRPMPHGCRMQAPGVCALGGEQAGERASPWCRPAGDRKGPKPMLRRACPAAPSDLRSPGAVAVRHQMTATLRASVGWLDTVSKGFPSSQPCCHDAAWLACTPVRCLLSGCYTDTMNTAMSHAAHSTSAGHQHRMRRAHRQCGSRGRARVC